MRNETYRQSLSNLGIKRKRVCSRCGELYLSVARRGKVCPDCSKVTMPIPGECACCGRKIISVGHRKIYCTNCALHLRKISASSSYWKKRYHWLLEQGVTHE